MEDKAPQVEDLFGSIEVSGVSFRYSEEEGTWGAANLVDDVPEEGHCVIATTYPAGLGNNGHICRTTGAYGTEHHQ